MKLVLADATYLRDSISVISELVTEARFRINKDGLEMIAMDPASVAMVVYKLLSSCFQECEVEEEQEIALNLANLKQVLRRSSANDILTLELEENKLKLQLKGKSTRTFSLPLLEVDEREQKIPSLSFPITVSVPSDAFASAIDDVSIVSDAVTLAAEPEKFWISGEGDLSKANIEMGTDDAQIESETKAKIKAKYSLEYLKKMIAGSKVADTVNVRFNQDYPLRLDYTVIDRVSLSFILAPRVEND